MRILRYDDFLNELKIEDGYNKNTYGLTELEYYTLVLGDPTNKPNYKDLNINLNNIDLNKVKGIQQGQYYGQIIRNYKDNIDIYKEDFDKIYNTLSLFNQFKSKLVKKDINQYKSLGEIYEAVKEYDPNYKEAEFTNEDEQKLVGEFKVVFKNNYCRIIIPLTLKASEYFAQSTQQCTQYPDNFKKYTKKQNPNSINENNLYIIYTQNPDDRLQFHFKHRQFMDINDKLIDIKSFFNIHKDIYNFFKQINNMDKYLEEIKTYPYEQWLENGKPSIIEGNFDCNDRNLTSLIGFPKIIEGYFDCSKNNLTSLEGAPIEVGGSFDCSYNQLTSLVGAPSKICEDFDCSSNQLMSLEGAPSEVGRNFNCSFNNLTSLEGAPIEVSGSFDCSRNNLTSLEGAPNKVGWNFYCYRNNLTSLQGAPNKVGWNFDCSWNTYLPEEEIEKYKKSDVVNGWFYY